MSRLADFAAVDFETANSDRYSVCSMAVVIVSNGAISGVHGCRVKPENPVFDVACTKLHGIRAAHVADAPRFEDAWLTMEELIDGRPLVAHNAGFDVGIVNHFRQRSSRPFVAEQYACTSEMAQALIPGLDNHRLDTLTDLFGINLNHHDAESDAVACAILATLFDRIAVPGGLASYLRAISDCGNRSDERGYVDVQVNGSSQRMRTNGYGTICKKCGCEVAVGAGVMQHVRGKWTVDCRACFTPIQQPIVAAPDGRFNGLKFIFTGEFNVLSRDDAEKHATAHGAQVTDSISKFSDYVVVSDAELVRYKRDGSATNKLDKAYKLVAEGKKLKILSESQYLEMIS